MPAAARYDAGAVDRPRPDAPSARSRDRPARALATYVAATRPGFLSVTAVAVVLGTCAAAWAGAAPRWPEAAVALLFALVAHAGANVVNDFHDAHNGSDAINVDRVAPYTGGSRLIQDGRLDARRVGAYGALLLAAVVPAGLWLAGRSGPGLVGIGAAGLAIGWAYSAPPLALMSRGLGEPAVALAWWLVAIGAAYVQAGGVDAAAAIAGGGYALSVAAILFVNQFPDARADAAVGKRNWVVRAGPARARVVFPAILAAAHALPLAAIAAGVLPAACAIGASAALPAAFALRGLWRDALVPARLAPAIRATIASALLHGAGLAAGFVVAGRAG